MDARTFLSTVTVSGVLAMVVCASPADAQETLSPERLMKAREELLTRLEARPRAELEARNYIMPGDRLEDIQLGEPCAFYRIEGDCLKELTNNRLFKQCLTFCMWDIPVSFGGQSRLLLGLVNRNGEWRLAHYGKDPTVIEDARSRWPKSEGYTISYLMEVMGPDFIMIQKGDNIWLYSFRERNERMLGIKKDQSGRYPLLGVPYVVKKLKVHETHFAPKMD